MEAAPLDDRDRGGGLLLQLGDAMRKPRPIVTKGRTVTEIFEDITKLREKGHDDEVIQLLAGELKLVPPAGTQLDTELRPGERLFGILVV